MQHRVGVRLGFDELDLNLNEYYVAIVRNIWYGFTVISHISTYNDSWPLPEIHGIG